MTDLDGSSNLTQVVDGEKHTTAQSLTTTDPYRLLSTQDAARDTVQVSYSATPVQPGWVAAITDARSSQQQFAYDT